MCLERAVVSADGHQPHPTCPAFSLVLQEGSAEERDFLEAAAHLATIPGVEAFELLAEVSPKNGYRFGILMELADRAAYDRYNEHPDHVHFVEERSVPEVSECLELAARRTSARSRRTSGTTPSTKPDSRPGRASVQLAAGRSPF
jgi:hypothetical protein